MHVVPIFKSLQWQEMLVEALISIRSKITMSAYYLCKSCTLKAKDGQWAPLHCLHPRQKENILKERPKGQKEGSPADINWVGQVSRKSVMTHQKATHVHWRRQASQEAGGERCPLGAGWQMGSREEGRVFGDKDRHLVLNDEISRGVCREGYTANKGGNGTHSFGKDILDRWNYNLKMPEKRMLK